MSALGAITGSLVGGIWKVAAIGMAITMAASSAYLGGNWWLAERDLAASKVELVTERALSAQYRDSIAEQNRAVGLLKSQKDTAEARGQAAQQIAAANGRRFDQVLAATRAAHALNCADAMPVVDMVRDALR